MPWKNRVPCADCGQPCQANKHPWCARCGQNRHRCVDCQRVKSDVKGHICSLCKEARQCLRRIHNGDNVGPPHPLLEERIRRFCILAEKELPLFD